MCWTSGKRGRSATSSREMEFATAITKTISVKGRSNYKPSRSVCGRSRKNESEKKRRKKLLAMPKQREKQRSGKLRFNERVKLRVVVTNSRQTQMTHEG